MPIHIDDEPRVLTEINIVFGGWFHRLYSVTTVGDDEIWISGRDKTMKLFNLQRKFIKSAQTKSGQWT